MNKLIKLVLIITFYNFLLVGKSYSQEIYRYRFSTGIGLSLLGSGDNTALNFENEFGVKVNKWMSTTATLNYGRAFTTYKLFSSSFIQGNLNILFHSFHKNRLGVNFGIGLSIFDLNEVRTSVYPPDNISHFYFNDYTTVGINLIFEPRYNNSAGVLGSNESGYFS